MKKRVLSRQRVWQIRNRDKAHAHQAVGRAVATGRLAPVSECADCGAPPPLSAHHHMGYAKEHRLDVKWLCGPCHAASHVHQNRVINGVAAESMTEEQIEELRRQYPARQAAEDGLTMHLYTSRDMKTQLDAIAKAHGSTVSALIRSILERAIAEGVEIG